MAGLVDLVKAGVVLARQIAGPFRAQVTHRAKTGRNEYGPTFGSPVKRLAVIEDVAEEVTTADGKVTTSKAKLTFIEPLVVLEGDEFKIPAAGGRPERVLHAMHDEGVLDPDALPYVTQVLLG